MNNKIKIEVWDDDLAKDERVGTCYVNFKDLMNKSSEPKWANLYGPPLQAEGEYADLMTKYEDKGSTYRGRLLYSVTTHDEENPKSTSTDLKFSFPSNPAPYPKEKAYLLKVALYEGIELPEFEEFAITVSCGPYETKSKLVKNNNSRAVWNQYLPDLVIRAPENVDEIWDVFIYLSTSNNLTDRICFKRIKAKDLLDIRGKKWTIDKYLLEEDKSIDPLDDEQFPGIIQARIKLYAKGPEDKFPADLFKDESEYLDYLL
jgi:hypothetical protein